MAMTREEAILEFETMLAKYAIEADEAQAIGKAFEALRPVSREQVEKVWRGEWIAFDDCSNNGLYCARCRKKVYRIEFANVKMKSPFCPNCGAAQTDEAVDILLKRLEALKDGSTTD